MKEKLKRWCGLSQHSAYVRDYIDTSNMKAIVCMCIFVIFVELWMTLRTIGIILFDIEQRSPEWIATHMRLYIVLLGASVVMLCMAILYLKGKYINHVRLMSIMCIYTTVCVGFGMYISYLDYLKGEQILSFLTMILFVGCLVVWRPYISIIMLAVVFGGFYYICDKAMPATVATDINMFTTYVAAVMISVGNYNQRLNEAQKDQDLEDISTHDDLTGISNMHYFRKRADSMLKDAYKQGKPLTFLYFDIENFKTYNERYGFIKGNELLVKMATYIKGEYSKGETARLSDDHFVVLIDDNEPEKRIETIQQRLSRLEGETCLRVKAGIYRTDGMKKDSDELEDINILCDRARFAAGSIKRKSDVSYCVYDEKLHERQRLKRYIISHLDSAIANGHIKILYQPQIDAKTNKVIGLEALSRWHDPEFGMLSPADFIETLEEFRFIHKLDKHVIELVCSDIRKHMENGERDLHVSINLSRLDFELCDIADIIIEVAGDIPRDMLVIEVTESALNENQIKLKKAIEKLRRDGFEIWLDDFGSGYSSLNVLKDFDFDVLKIDMRFLEGFGNSENLKPILENVIRMADSLNMRSLAEGVETKEEYEFLKNLGCDMVQGYLFSKPVSDEGLSELFASGKLIKN